MLKRVWAIVAEKDFYGVQKQAREDNISMGEALASLTHLYASGKIKLNRVEAQDHYKKINAGVDYVKEHRLAEVDKSLIGEDSESKGKDEIKAEPIKK